MTSLVEITPARPRKRLANYDQQRGAQTGFSVPGAFLFGSVFIFAGVFIALIGTHTIPVDPSTVHAPFGIIVVCGACFAGGGLMVWSMAVRQWRAEWHRRRTMRTFAGSNAHADFPWNPAGYTPSRWGRAAKAVIGTAIFSLFAVISNWWAFGADDSPWLVKVVAVVFDAVVVVVWWRTALIVARCAKFTGSKLVFHHFPYRLDEPIAVRWIPPRGVSHADKGTITFRCVEEYYEERQSGKDRERWLVHDELCAETQTFDSPRDFATGRPVEMRFAIPADARGTCLSSERPVYWELEVKLSRAGLDFEEWYLVPVYAR